MWKETTSLSLFVLVFVINNSFSAIFWYFTTKSRLDDYSGSRAASFHRGLFLSYSIVQKQLLCEDLFSAQLYVVPKPTNGEDRIDELITDGQGTEGPHQYPLTVTDISLTGEDNVVTAKEIFIKCFGKKFDERKPFNMGEFYISYGFQYGRWFVSTRLEVHRLDRIILGYNIGASPQNVPLELAELEQRYLTTREAMEALKDESPAYASLIERKDDLLELPRWKWAVLCASILSSPIYRKERLEYSTKWILKHKDNLKYEPKLLTFAYHNRRNEPLTCDCIICKGFANGNDEKSESTNLCITRSYDNRGSVYVMKPDQDFYYPDKYFEKVPILVDVHEPMADDTLFKNYNDE